MRIIKTIEELQKLSGKPGGISVSIYQLGGGKMGPYRITYDANRDQWTYVDEKPGNGGQRPHSANSDIFRHMVFHDAVNRERLIHNN